MEFKPIFEDNMSDYSDLVDIDIAENMGRMYYRGLAAHDPENDDPLSLLIYRLKSLEGSRNSESELLWIYAAEPSCIASLLDGSTAFFWCMPALRESWSRFCFLLWDRITGPI